MTTTANAIARNAALKLKIAEMERKQRDREASQELLNENQILAQRLRDLKKAAAEAKKARKVYTRQKPYNVHSNPYLTFLSGAREGLKTEILAVQPGLKGKELTCAVTTLAGHRWRQMSAEERAGYKITPTVLFENSADNEEWMPWSPEAPAEEEEGLQLQEVVVQGADGQEPFTIWIDTCSNPSTAFRSNSTDEGPIGQVFEGRYIPF
jgi:hypothetical protein